MALLAFTTLADRNVGLTTHQHVKCQHIQEIGKCFITLLSYVLCQLNKTEDSPQMNCWNESLRLMQCPSSSNWQQISKKYCVDATNIVYIDAIFFLFQLLQSGINHSQHFVWNHGYFINEQKFYVLPLISQDFRLPQ
ncbi:hypothetical protein TNCV_2486541 [Trichonephila clavipes]|uniref:Uncharacterized protein n=1 Tax=Trichonephila clavipes TaxID=2585209 RepID=A0A8X7BCD1_TRICX|nr:hypothetical protein TNCV_2486541 [Trichonephila clavipes]